LRKRDSNSKTGIASRVRISRRPRRCFDKKIRARTGIEANVRYSCSVKRDGYVETTAFFVEVTFEFGEMGRLE
jgi:hypothetical protein